MTSITALETLEKLSLHWKSGFINVIGHLLLIALKCQHNETWKNTSFVSAIRVVIKIVMLNEIKFNFG